MPLISVLMPAYNSERYIEDAINSILMQSFSDFELIIINDGSIDNTESIIKNYTDPRIKYIKNEINKGLIYTLNKGLELSKGKYIARMDSDDISHPLRFQKQFDFLEANHSISLLGTAYSIIGTDKIVYHPKSDEQIKIRLLTDTALAHPSVMFVKKDFQEYNLSYDIDFNSAEDYKLWTDVSLSKLKIANLDDVLLNYRVHEQQISTAKVSEQYNSVKKIRKEYARSIYGDKLNDDDYDIIKDGFRRHHPYMIILLLLKMKDINASSHYFDNTEFELFFQDRMKGLVSIVGRHDILILLLSKAPIQLRMLILRSYINNLLNKKIKHSVNFTSFFNNLFSFTSWREFIHKKRYHYLIKLINKKVRQQIKDPFSIPLIIINYNRLRDLQILISDLSKYGHKNIVIVDNNSTYPPLLKYYETIEDSVKIERMKENYGHLVFWKNKELTNKYGKGYYILTDSDIALNRNLPLNYINTLMTVLDKNKDVTKVGFALDISDIPDNYKLKEKVMEWESKYWDNPIQDILYKAYIDTTFALYPPFYIYNKSNFFDGIRVGGDYTSRHMGWYIVDDNWDDEDLFYFNTSNSSNTWKLTSKKEDNG